MLKKIFTDIIPHFFLVYSLIGFSPIYPQNLDEIQYFCSADSTLQPAMFYNPESSEKIPLLVGLHPWSADYKSSHGVKYFEWCKANDWMLIFPDFRGKNNRAEATGSDLAVQDIVDAVNYCISRYNIDENRIYLIGASGGGHMALLMAGRRPDIWAGVSAWVPITDLTQWYIETKNMGFGYWTDIEKSCGGDPTIDTDAYESAMKRSPNYYLAEAANVSIDINAGIQDGHGSYSVPISHSLNSFNILAVDQDTLSRSQIEFFTDGMKVPQSLFSEFEDDPMYGEKEVLFRRNSGNARVTIFGGIHEIIYNAGLSWLALQKKSNVSRIEKYLLSEPDFTLMQNYPNPFNSGTIINFSLPEGGYICLRVYDLLGRLLSTPVDEYFPGGSHSITLKAEAVNIYSSGIYFYALSKNNQRSLKQLLYLK